MTLYGWDGSHYDWTRGPMDLVQAKAAGISFMNHKIGEGTGYTDPKFATWYKRAKAAGLPLLGAYYVNHNGNQAAQADRFLALLDDLAHGWRDGPFILQIDAERWDSGTPTPAEVLAFAARLRSKAPEHMPFVYAPKWVYGDKLKGEPYPLWASSYGSNPVATFRAAYPGDKSARWAPYSGVTPAILQYGSRTTIGNQHTCDANAYRGSLANLMTLCYPGEDDELTPEQLTAAVKAAIADELPAIAEAVWSGDYIPAARPPVANADYGDPKDPRTGNKTWRGSYGLQTAVENVRLTRQELTNDMRDLRALLAQIPGADTAALADAIAAKVADTIARRLVS